MCETCEKVEAFVDAHLLEGAPQWATLLLTEIKMIFQSSTKKEEELEQ